MEESNHRVMIVVVLVAWRRCFHLPTASSSDRFQEARNNTHNSIGGGTRERIPPTVTSPE